MEKFEPKLEEKKENIQEEVDEIRFENLEKGDKLIIYTSSNPKKNLGTRYEIETDKIAKTREGKIKHLNVSFKYFIEGYKDSDEGKELVAKIPGGFSRVPEKWHYGFLERGKKGAKPIPKEILDKIGPTPGIIRKGDNEVLEFNDVNYKNIFETIKSGKRRMFYCRSMSTTPVRKIILIKNK